MIHRHLHPLLQYLLISLVLIAAILYSTQPASRHLTSRIIGSGLDLWGTLWLHWFQADKPGITGQSTSTSYLFYPIGKDITADMANFIDCRLAVPLHHIIPWPFGYNAAALLFMLITALAAAALGRKLTSTNTGALLCSILYTCSAYSLNELARGRITQILMPGIPLALWAYIRLLEERRWRHAILLAACVIFTSLTYWFHGVFLVLGLTFYTLVQSRDAKIRSRSFILPLLAAAALALLVLIPFAQPYLSGHYQTGVSWFAEFATPADIDRAADTGTSHLRFYREGSLDLAQLIRLPVIDPPCKLRGRLAPLLLLLAFVPLSIPHPRRRTAARFILSGIFMLLFACGPYLRINGHWLTIAGCPIPGPFILFHRFVPFMSRLWWPYRFLSLAGLFLSAAAACNLTGLLMRLPERYRRTASTLTVITVIAAAPLTGIQPQSTDPGVPFVYHRLATASPGVLIDLPLGRIRDQFHLYAQTFHQHPMLNGMGDTSAILRPPGYDRYIDRHPFLRFLKDVDAPGLPELDTTDILACRAEGFRWIVCLPRNFENAGIDQYTFQLVLDRISQRLGPPERFPGGAALFRLPDPITEKPVKQ